MNNNDIIRRLRYTLDFNDQKMISVFALANVKVSRSDLSNWLKKDDDPLFQECYDKDLAIFLNGLIVDMRGKKEGVEIANEKSLTNNLIFRKLKIAYNLKDEDIIKIFDLADLRVGKSELSAFFRKPDNKKYRICKDQFLRNFLHGLQKKYYVAKEDENQ